MKPRRFIKEAFKSEKPVAAAIAMLRIETSETPELRELIEALFVVYLHDTYRTPRFSYKDYFQMIERRCDVSCQ